MSSSIKKLKELVRIKIPLLEEDLFWNKEFIQVVWVNQMYTWWKMSWRHWKRLTPEAVKYKNYLKGFIQDYIESKLNWIPFNQDLVFVIQFNLVVPITKSWEPNKAYRYDLDNLYKPVQDVMSCKKDYIGIWNDDSQVRMTAWEITYNKDNKPSIYISVREYKETDSLVSDIFSE